MERSTGGQASRPAAAQAAAPAAAATPALTRFQMWGIGLLSAGHFLLDGYLGFLPALWPLLIKKYSLSLTEVGLVATMMPLLLFPAQPLSGAADDRGHGRILLLVGPLMCAIGLCSIGVAPSFWAFVAFVLVGRVGNAMYHPVSARLVTASIESRAGLAMSIFHFAGNFGIAVGPVAVLALVGVVGLDRLQIAALPGLVIVGTLYAYTSRQARLRDVFRPTAHAAGKRARLRVAGPFLALIMIAATRSGVWASMNNFIPIYLVGNGFSPMIGGVAVSIFNLAGAVFGLYAGAVSDRMDRGRVFAITMLAASGALALFLATGNLLGLVWLGVAGAGLLASTSIAVVMAQEMNPDHRALAAGMVMGMAYGLGSSLVAPVGWLADRVGVPGALWAATGVCFAASLAAFLVLPARARKTLRQGTP
jgi:FSR family fosmidomycin resistance protein-like MFS transporter